MGEEFNYTCFWYLNDKNTLCIDNLSFTEFLSEDLGFYNGIVYGKRCLVKIETNIVKLIEDKTFIVNAIISWLDKNFDHKIEDGIYKDVLKGKLLNKSQFLLSESVLYFLPIIETKPHFDTKEAAYFYFENTVVNVTDSKLSFLNYSELNGHVMQEQIIDREFHVPECDDILSIPFAQFIFNVSGQDEERFVILMTLIGYVLHRYIDLSNVKVVILYDGSINELNDTLSGSVGKGVLSQAFGYMRVACDIEGKKFKGNDKFSLQRVTPNTNIICINDITSNQNLEDFFCITDGITIEQKYKPQIYIDRNRVPKMILSSNYIIKAPAGYSSERRKHEFEFSNHYGKHRNPHDDFGHYFYHDWSESQWNEFTFFMLYCVQMYLQHGLLEVPSIHLEQRQLITEVGLEYIGFFDEVFTNAKKTKFHKKELYKEFISGGYVLAKNRPTQRTFTMKLHKYLAYKDIAYTETPLNTKAYIQIINEAYTKEQQLITIKDVDTNYKTVDTPNKMTRMVKALTQHFEATDTKLMAVDLETTSLNPLDGNIICLALSVEKHKGYNIIFPKQRNKVAQFISPLLPFLQDNQIAKVFHNYKFDLKFLNHYGIPINGNVHDTLILDYLLDPDRKKHGLKEISELHLGYKQINFKQMLDSREITEVSAEELTRYAVEDTDLTLQLYYYLTEKLNQND